MWQHLFLCFAGICAGVITASGVVGLLIGLSIIPRYAGVTRTAEHILLYEDVTLLGTTLGSLCYIFQLPLPLGRPFLALGGFFFGVFLGSWILALAEIADIFPILFRRIKFREGIPKLIICIALGKITGSLLCSYLDWF